MSKATPITSLDNSPSSNEGLQMPIIQDILDEIGHEEVEFPNEPTPMVAHETRGAMNTPRLDYQMDPNVNPIPNNNYMGNVPNAMNMYQNSLVNRGNQKSILSTILREVRLPVLVVLMYTVFRRVRLDTLLVKKLPFAMSNGSVNITGTLLTALLFGVVFWSGKFALENININI